MAPSFVSTLASLGRNLAWWSARPTPLRSAIRLSLRYVSWLPSPSALRFEGPTSELALLALQRPSGGLVGCSGDAASPLRYDSGSPANHARRGRGAKAGRCHVIRHRGPVARSKPTPRDPISAGGSARQRQEVGGAEPEVSSMSVTGLLSVTFPDPDDHVPEEAVRRDDGHEPGHRETGSRRTRSNL